MGREFLRGLHTRRGQIQRLPLRGEGEGSALLALAPCVSVLRGLHHRNNAPPDGDNFNGPFVAGNCAEKPIYCFLYAVTLAPFFLGFLSACVGSILLELIICAAAVLELFRINVA